MARVQYQTTMWRDAMDRSARVRCEEHGLFVWSAGEQVRAGIVSRLQGFYCPNCNPVLALPGWATVEVDGLAGVAKC